MSNPLKELQEITDAYFKSKHPTGEHVYPEGHGLLHCIYCGNPVIRPTREQWEDLRANSLIKYP